MGREIERKFLVARSGWRAAAKKHTRLVQGYLPTAEGRTVRVRIAGKKAFLTIKGPSKGAARDEFEYPIPVKDAEKLLSRHCVAGLIDKIRHIVPFKGKRWEVDEFRGAHQGLILAELELSSSKESFAKPDWLGKEVTGERRYDNSALAKRSKHR